MKHEGLLYSPDRFEEYHKEAQRLRGEGRSIRVIAVPKENLVCMALDGKEDDKTELHFRVANPGERSGVIVPRL